MAQWIKNPPSMQETQVWSLGREAPLEKEMEEEIPTPVFLPEKFHRQNSLAGYSPKSCKESDMTERLSLQVLK